MCIGVKCSIKIQIALQQAYYMVYLVITTTNPRDFDVVVNVSDFAT